VLDERPRDGTMRLDVAEQARFDVESAQTEGRFGNLVESRAPTTFVAAPETASGVAVALPATVGAATAPPWSLHRNLYAKSANTASPFARKALCCACYGWTVRVGAWARLKTTNWFGEQLSRNEIRTVTETRTFGS
jgi:hypothetical protein